MRKALTLFATSSILVLSLLLVGSALASDPSITITPDTTVFISSGDSVRIWIYASDPDPLATITVEKSFGAGTYDPKTELAPIADEFYFQPDTAGVYTFIFPVTDDEGATSSDTTLIIVSPVKVDFGQSANDDSPYPLGDVHWIGSILQQSNSKYYEGMSTLQRLVFVGIPKTAGHVHTLDFSHQANKSANIHAYDFLTSWDQGMQAAYQIDSTLLVNLNECGPEIGPPANLGAICSSLHASGFTATADAPDAMDSVIGDDVAFRVTAYEAQLGNRTIKIYGNAPVSAASVTFNGYTGSTDKQAEYTLAWTSSSDSIVIEMAGHLAAGIDPVGQTGVGYGAGRGSANISGGPYHFKLSLLDSASIGSQDNQIKGADIVLPSPVCDVTPSVDTVCVGFDATFTENTTSGTPPYTYCWEKSPYPGGCIDTTNQLTITGATLADAGTYRMIVTDANSLSDTCYATLVVHPNPTCTVDPPSAVICEGDSQQFCVVPSGGIPPYTYEWNTGATTECINVSAAGTYSVTVTDANGCEGICQATLTVNPNPSCTVDPPSASICEGENQQFCVVPSGGTPPYTYEWSNGTTTECINVSAAGTYSVTVTDANGCEGICQATLTVNPNPICTVDPPSASICEGESQQFCVVPSGGTPPYSYEWSNGATTECINVSTAGTYSVTVTDANGCETNCQGTLTVNPGPSCSVDPPSASICEGESQQFCVVPSGGTPPYTYEWNTGATTECINVSSAGTYSVTVTDANGCEGICQATLTVNPNPSCSVDPPSASICEGESQQFCVVPSGGTPPYIYEWSTGATTECINVSTAGTYSVTVTDANGCETNCQGTLTVNPGPSCSVDPPSAVICDGSSQEFCVVPSGGTAPYSFEWSNGATTECITVSAAGTYSVTVTDANGCTTSCTGSLEVVENPTCTIDPPADTICDGDQATFCVVPTGGTAPYTYLWSPGGEVTECITVSPPIGSYTYRVTVTDAQDCTSSCEATLTVYNLPPELTCPDDDSTKIDALFISSDFSVTDPDEWDEVTVSLLSVSPAPAVSPVLVDNHVEWTASVDDWSNGPDFTITLVATDLCGAADTCSFIVTVYNLPPIIIPPPDDSIHAGRYFASGDFSAYDQKGPVTVSICGINPPSANAPIIVESHVEMQTECDEAGMIFTICLQATDDCGATDRDSFTVTVYNRPPQVIPPDNENVHAGDTYISPIITATDPDLEPVDLIILDVSPTPTNPPALVDDHMEWTTDCEDDGDYLFTLVGSDSCGIADTAEFTLTVYNQAPSLTCPSDDSVHACDYYVSTDFSATDPDGDPVTVTLCGITPASTNPPIIVANHVEWQTDCADDGVFDICLVATDSCGVDDTCYFQVTVYNQPPVLECDIGGTVTPGGLFVSASFSFYDPDGDPADAFLVNISPPATNDPVIVGNHVEWVTTTSESGTYVITLGAVDSCEFDTVECGFSVTVTEGCCPSVWIGTVDCVNPGDYVSVPIYLYCTPPFGGFELEVEFDYTSMCFVSAERGALLNESYTDQDGIFWSWEYFTYRVLPCPIPPCQKYKILLYGQAETPNGLMNRGLPIPELDAPDTLVLLNFVVMNNELLRGFEIPICWEWEGTIDPETGCLVEDWNCGENTFSSVTGDTLYTSILCCQFVDSLCDDPTPGIEPILNFQPQTECAPVCGQVCGGVVVCPAGPSICKRGDVNMNTVTYEVADAVLFASYFVHGTGVFIHDQAYQICATDANADGRALTLSDLIYLIRVILHDAVEIPKLAPASEVTNVIVYNNTITTECAAPIAAILFEFDGAVSPTLLADMEMVYNDNKVLVWSRDGNSFTTAEILTFTGDAELVSVTAVDYDTRELKTSITAKVAPAAFALHQAYPNPFNPNTNLRFDLPQAMRYSLKIYNVAGQLVKSYEGMGSVGSNQITWDGSDNAGVEVASGLYFYRLAAGDFVATKRMVMLK